LCRSRKSSRFEARSKPRSSRRRSASDSSASECAPAPLVAAAIFGLAHLALRADGVPLDATLVEVVSALALGLVAGYVYQRTGNLWYGIVLHALCNLGGA